MINLKARAISKEELTKEDKHLLPSHKAYHRIKMCLLQTNNLHKCVKWLNHQAYRHSKERSTNQWARFQPLSSFNLNNSPLVTAKAKALPLTYKRIWLHRFTCLTLIRNNIFRSESHLIYVQCLTKSNSNNYQFRACKAPLNSNKHQHTKDKHRGIQDPTQE